MAHRFYTSNSDAFLQSRRPPLFFVLLLSLAAPAQVCSTAAFAQRKQINKIAFYCRARWLDYEN
jgi:hypothetical protein